MATGQFDDYEDLKPSHFRDVKKEKPAAPAEQSRGLLMCAGCGSPDWPLHEDGCPIRHAEVNRVWNSPMTGFRGSRTPDAAPSVAPEPVEMRPYNPTEAMRWAAKRIDPALPHEHIRALWCVMWSAYAHPPRSPLTDAEIDAMWQVAYPDLCDEPRCSFDWFEAGIRALEQAHGIGGK